MRAAGEMLGGLFSWMSGAPATTESAPKANAEPATESTTSASPEPAKAVAPAAATPDPTPATTAAAATSSPAKPAPTPKPAKPPPVVKTAEAHEVTSPPKAASAEPASPPRVGTFGPDNFMQQHVRKVSAQMSPPKVHTGIKAQIGADSFMNAHVAKASQIRGHDTSGPHRATAGVPHKMGADGFMINHTKSLQPKSAKKEAGSMAKNTGSDAFMAQFVKKSREQSPTRERDKLAGFAKPHMTSESLGLRVTKPGPHPIHGNHTRGSQGVRSHLGGDSFMMNHLRGMAGWSSQRDRPREVRI
jgi:hypothetical protein